MGTTSRKDSRIFPALRRFGVGFAVVALSVYAVYLVFDPFGDSLDGYFDNGVPDALIALATFACFFRAFGWRRERAAWLVIGSAMLSSTFGEIYWNAVIAYQESPPYPSTADFFYLAFYPLMFVGLTMLALRHAGKMRISLWLHSLIAVLTVSAIDAAVVFDSVNGASTGRGWEQATNLAYPLADIFILMSVVGIWGLSGWRPSAAWRWIGGGMLIYAIGDAVFAYQTAHGGFEVGGLIDLTWPLAAAMLLVAATRRGDVAMQQDSASSPWLFLPTGLFATLSIGILVWDHFSRVGTLAMLLATVASLVVIVQLGLAFLENLRLLANSERDASVDLVTEIPNRRKLMVDLKRACADATAENPRLLALFDLEGFKAVNDTLGHSAGDRLLRQFAARLTGITGSLATTYRLDGVEFCMIFKGDLYDAKPLLERASAVLVEHGDGFSVDSSFGFALLPADTRDAEQALHIADRRMRAMKPMPARSELHSSRVAGPPAGAAVEHAQHA